MKKKIGISISLLCAAVICAVVVGLAFGGGKSKASSANISLSVDSQTVKKEQEFTLKVTVSSDAAMQNIDTMLKYNPEVLEYISSDSTSVAGASGMIHIMESFLDPVNEKTYTLTFKALEVGQSDLGVSDTYIEDAETFSVISASSDNIGMEVVTNKQESAETRLSQLLVSPGTMNVEFDPDTYTYMVDTAYEDETVAISAIPMDENAVVTMEKTDTLAFGANTVTITVTAPSGHTGVYTLTINRADTPESESQASVAESASESALEGEPESESGETVESESADTIEGETWGNGDVLPETAETVVPETANTESQPVGEDAMTSQSEPQI